MDAKVAKCLKDLPARLQTHKLTTRKEIFADLVSLVEEGALQENIVKGVVKVLPLTLLRYKDAASRALPLSFLVAAVAKYPETTAKMTNAALLEAIGSWKTSAPSRALAKDCLAAMAWSQATISGCPGVMESDGAKVADLHSVLVAVIMAAGASREKAKLDKLMLAILKEEATRNRYVEVLLGLEPSMHVLVLGSLLTGHLLKLGESGEKLKVKLLEILSKTVLTSKTKPRYDLLKQTAPFLKNISHEEFSSSLMPAMSKYLLRSPEIALACVSCILDAVSIDLSVYAQELGKTFTSNLKSKDDGTREDAVKAMLALGRQSSNQEAVSGLVRQLFSVLGGSEGKITVNTHKVSLLNAIGNLTNTTVSGSGMSTLAVLVTELFVKFLETEAHEGTLVTALEMLSRWGPKFNAEIPAKLLDWMPKGMFLKATTSSVRSAYLVCLGACLNGSTLASALPLIPSLVKIVDAAAKQPTQQLVVTEGVHAAAALVKIASVDTSVITKLGETLDLITEPAKLLFFNDKFLSNCGSLALQSVANLGSTLLISYSGSLDNERMRGVMRGIVSALLTGSSSVRRQTVASLKRVGNTLGGPALLSSLLVEMGTTLRDRPLTLDTPNRGDVGAGGEIAASGDPTGWLIGSCAPAGWLVSSLTSLLPVSATPEETEDLAISVLIPANQPLVKQTYRGLWSHLCKSMGLDASEILLKHQARVLELILVEIRENREVGVELVKGVVDVCPGAILPYIVNSLKEVLTNKELLKVTVDDHKIYLTPPGELYDKSVIDSKNEVTGSIKRESAVYSYKEQMEEIELRKEIEEKKRKEGKLKKPELTSKQREAMKAQLEKEDKIREKMSGLVALCTPALDLFDAALQGRPVALACEVTSLLQTVYGALQSPLVAERLSGILRDLRLSVFTAEDETLAQLVAGVNIQILKPAFELPFVWSRDELNMTLHKVLGVLYKSCVPPEEEGEEDNSCPLAAPAFAYSFPIIKAAMYAFNANQEVVTQGLELISEHTCLRGEDDEVNEGGIDMFHPRYLPRGEILELLIHLIGSTDGIVQQAAVKALIDAATSGSGDAGCATASSEEIRYLLNATQMDSDATRDAGLRGLLAMTHALPKDESIAIYPEIVRRTWVAKCDPLPENQLLADQLWEELELEILPGLMFLVLEDVAHPVGKVRGAAAEGLAKLLEADSDLCGPALTQLLEMYEEKLILTPPLVDGLGRIIEKAIDHWEPRSGIAIALAKIAKFYNDFMVTQAVSFFVPKGLGDRNEAVRKDMLGAAVTTIDLHGKETVGDLLPVFEDFMDSSPNDRSYDIVRQSVVILMGSMARHLDKDNPKIRPIIAKLINALGTPSQPVQEAVANCLPPLVSSIKDEAPDMVNRLLTTLLTTENYGERKGAAYGLAGIIKGLGILALKQLDVMTRLTEALQDKKNHRHREGALLALSQLCSMLGRLFEPYIVHVLPHLLLCFGDPNQYVREATDDCAKAVMSKLSAHGVKLVLPSLLAALEEDQWRTKAGSIELLGAMAYCAPKQLSSCLPSIVPKLIEVLGDSHVKVQTAGVTALKQIGSVIRNPEIQAIVPTLLQALQDPAKKTSFCLKQLLNTKFVHFIDAPSLALIMPVVQRAFQDRSTETRKMAAQIIGNMYSLTDQKDLSPYLPGIIPGLKSSLLDPVPEVRAVSARALGAMVRGMGESSFEDLLPWLMTTLTSENSSVDRSGAAQGLAEVVGGLGVDKMHKLMPEIIATAERMDIAPHVKDGYIMLFIYFPGVFQEEFMQYISDVVKPILRALADENEYVRDTALKAGQRLVNLYSDSAITLLMPQLEMGLFDDNWRIRYSSVQLLGDLLYKISGVSGKMTTETASEDDNFGTEASSTIITKMLGQERRNRVLAGLYMGRSDVALMVRQAALHVWKIIVSNTPRTLREILPTLFNLLLSCLASPSYDKRQVAARTLGDLVRKLGERVLPEIIPILEEGLLSDDTDKRQGVCVGLSEIMISTSRDMVMSFVDSLVPTVQRALCDKDPDVRMAAAKTFDSLHTTVGTKALDDILPHMLEQLSDPDLHDYTLDGLRQVMAIKSRAVLPYLVPQLTASPVNTKALSILASVAGEALNKHLSKILPALLKSLEESYGTEDEARELQYSQAVILSVTDDVGVSYVMDILVDSCRAKDVASRRGAVTLLHAFCEQTKINIAEYVPQLIRVLMLVFTDKDEGVLKEAWAALNSVTKTLDADAQRSHVQDVRQALRFAVSEMKEGALLPGFCIAKGITPVLPIFRESILNGSPEQKEAAAQGLGEVIKVTSAEALKPSVVHITGPLIRILGDRFVHSVKTAVLDTLAILLDKASAMLKPFLPQLQTTFLKALNDTNRMVRLKAGTALSHLVGIHTRPDPLFNELHTGIKNQHDDFTVRDTYIQAMRGCVINSGDKLSPPIRRGVTATLLTFLGSEEDTTRLAAAGCLGSLLKWLPEEETAPIITDLLTPDSESDWLVRHGKSSTLYIGLRECMNLLYNDTNRRGKVAKIVLGYVASDRDQVACNGVRCASLIIISSLAQKETVPVDLLTAYSRAMNHNSSEVKEVVATATSVIARSSTDLLAPDLLKVFVTMLVNGTKEKNPAVKSSSESALVDLLKLRKGPAGQQKVLTFLDPGMRESLSEVISKSLTKLASQPDAGTPDIDNTVLT